MFNLGNLLSQSSKNYPYTTIDEDGFTATITKKRKDELTEMLTIKKKELLNCKRMVHLTEKGMIPLNIQIEIKKAANPKPSEEVQVKKANKIVKPKF